MLWGIGNKEHLDIDYRRHVEYLQSTKRILQGRLKERFGSKRGEVLWVRAKHIYEGFLDDLPYTGGRRNLQAHALYDSIMCFAYWEAMPADQRETVEEFEETVGLVFNGDVAHAKRKPEWLTANNEPLLRAIAPVGRLVFAWQNRVVRSGAWNNAWECRMSNCEEAPLHVELVGCPIADFARTHGYQHLMPAMCNPDHHSMTDFGMYLVRPSVVGKGDETCDYYIMGDRTPTALTSPAAPDEQGFLVNDLPTEKAVEPKLPYTDTYWRVIAPILRLLITRRYGRDVAAKAWAGARDVYRGYIDRAPKIGAGNPMAKNLYEACVFFALYTAADGTLTPDMMRAVVRDLFDLPFMKAAVLVCDLRTQKGVAKLNASLHENARWAQERPAIQNATWDFNFDDDKGGNAVAYHFTRCPINDFCRREGLMDILPVMCEIDDITPRLMHGRLTRKHTLALDGPCCDYLIEGE